MKVKTIPKYTPSDQIVDAINATGAYSIIAIAEYLGMRHSAVIYHFNEIPVLEKYYYSQHNFVIGQIEKEKREKVGHILRNARKNCPYIELYKPAGMKHNEFFYCVHSRKSLEKLFDRLYDGSRKMRKKTIDKVLNWINTAPPKTPIYKVKPGVNLSDYLLNNKELNDAYENKNGEIRVGRPI